MATGKWLPSSGVVFVATVLGTAVFAGDTPPSTTSGAEVAAFWVGFNAALGVMMVGAAGMLLAQAGWLRRLGWVALVLGVAPFIPVADFVALVVTALWIVVVSVALARGAAGAPATVAPRPA